MIVYLLYPFVVHTGPTPPPFGIVFDTIMADAPNATKGQVWTGSGFADPAPGSEQANLATIRTQAEAALTANLADIATNDGGIANNDAWLAANPSNSLAVGVLTPRVKMLVQQSTAAARQRNAMLRELNGVIRLLIGKLDGTG